ncbi:MAG: death-on-curing protein [Clostridia bacterium]|nr:death-on-curing protein [Clostridia bacterium]
MSKDDKNLVKKEFLIYSDDNCDVKVNVMLINNDLWLTQELIAELFDKDRTVITRHINNIFDEQELEEESNVQKMHFANLIKNKK